MSKKPSDYEMLTEMFKAFDKDGNGYIDKEELKNTMTNDLGIPLTEKETTEMINEADVNKDGKIDYNEFVSIMKKHSILEN
jgi:Ca2+-binding EF-hand superfamily protein